MSEASAKPYLVRALCEWCADKGLTPYLVVRVNDETQVPMDYVNNGEVVLNLSARTTHQLSINNEWIMFSARFGGVSQEVAIPFSAVAAIFAKETGYGLFFNAETPTDETPAGHPTDGPDKPKAGGEKKSGARLRLVK